MQTMLLPSATAGNSFKTEKVNQMQPGSHNKRHPVFLPHTYQKSGQVALRLLAMGPSGRQLEMRKLFTMGSETLHSIFRKDTSFQLGSWCIYGHNYGPEARIAKGLETDLSSNPCPTYQSDWHCMSIPLHHGYLISVRDLNYHITRPYVN